MCGVVGIVANQAVNQDIFDALTLLQHRGQDAAGIMTFDDGVFHLRKANGLVRDVVHTRHMQRLTGNIGIGHVRYPTAGSNSDAESQPFFVNSPIGLALAHNGNLVNSIELKRQLVEVNLRHLNTNSDSEVILNIFADKLQNIISSSQHSINNKSELITDIFQAVTELYKIIAGAFSVVMMIADIGLLAFKDLNGIRPLALGSKIEGNNIAHMVASESVAMTPLGFRLEREIEPGEAVLITNSGEVITKKCANLQTPKSPCAFEYIYFARPDSIINDISVYDARIIMGEALARKIKHQYQALKIDVVMPVPETSRHSALALANALGVKYREGLVKNRYIARTFIMPGQKTRKKSVRQKLNVIEKEFFGQNVLLVDDSIVRGTTSKEIVQMVTEAGVNKVYFASIAPRIQFANVYGIDMPTKDELIANVGDDATIAKNIGADLVIFQDIADLITSLRALNPNIYNFETSIFDGKYITKEVNSEYLELIAKLRRGSESSRKAKMNYNESEVTTLQEIYDPSS